MKHIRRMLFLSLFCLLCLLIFQCKGDQEVKEDVKQEEDKKTDDTDTDPVEKVVPLEPRLAGLLTALFVEIEGEDIPVVLEDPYLKDTRISTGAGFFLKQKLREVPEKKITFLTGIPGDFKRSGLTILYYGRLISYSLHPEYSINPDRTLTLSVVLKDNRSGKELKSESITFPVSLIEEINDSLPGETIQMPSYDDLITAQQFFNRDGINLTIFANVPNGGTIKHGDKISFSVTADTDCYIKIYNVCQSGDIYLLIPDFDYGPKENFIKAGEVFDPYSGTHELVVTNPVEGRIEVIHVIASTVQFDELRTWYNYKHWKGLQERPDSPVKQGDRIYYFRCGPG